MQLYYQTGLLSIKRVLHWFFVYLNCKVRMSSIIKHIAVMYKLHFIL
jgi:uncharacterized membrane protein (DUF106 family)